MAGEKRSQDYEDARDEKIIIVDIEGTTTSISFVKVTNKSMAGFSAGAEIPSAFSLIIFFLI